MCNNRLDNRDVFPSGMEEYLSYNGWHFSKKMCAWALSKIKDRNGNRLNAYDKPTVDSLLSKAGIVIENDKGYDAVYVMNMARADYWGSSITDENKLSLFTRDYIDDKDGYEGLPFTRWYADMIGKGCPIPWEDMI